MKSPHRGHWLMGMLLVVIAAIGIGLALSRPTPQRANPIDTTAVVAVINRREVRIDSNGVLYVVDPTEIMPAGLEKDGIPSIDHPLYVTAEEADQWITDDEWVLALDYRGISRAYPLQILVWHNIINDVVAGDPLLISYCPLCGSGNAYGRIINGQVVEFGTSGKLYKSNLVLYDRLTDSLWSQFEGVALIGSLAGQELTRLPVDTVSWREWKAAHPNADVLSRETGFDRDYDHDPYAQYCEDSFVMLPLEERARQIPAKTVVVGVEVNGHYAAYREADLISHESIVDRVGGVRISISRNASGEVIARDLGTNLPIEKTQSYWFAWASFHPTTTLNLFSDS